MLAAYLIVPGLALAFLIAGRGGIRRRLAQLAGGGVAMVAVSFAWYGTMMLLPASERPFVGDTTDDSWFSLIFGANGLSRVAGSGGAAGVGGTLGGGGGGGGRAGDFGGAAGIARLFNPIVGGQISWLLPLALLGLLLGLWSRRRAPRTDLERSAYLLWGGWGLVSWAIFSFSEGIFHPYYTTALAPAVAVLAAGGLIEMWDRARRSTVWAAALAAVALGTAVWASVLLARATGFVPWLAPAAIVLAALAGGALLLARVEDRRRAHAPIVRRLLPVAAIAGLLTMLAGPASYSVATVGDTLSGGNPLAGPAGADSGLGGGPGGGFPGGGFPGAGRGVSGGAGLALGGPGGPRLGGGVARSRLPIQHAGAIGQQPSGAPRGLPTGLPPGAIGRGAGGSAGGADGSFAGAGGNFAGASVSSALVKYLEAHQGTARYMVAAAGSNTAGAIALESGRNVIDMGGFMGADPAPTLAQVEHLIDTRQLHYILLGGQGGSPGSTGVGGLGGGTGVGGPSRGTGVGGPSRGTGVGGPSGDAGAGGHGAGSAAVETRDKWIESHGTAVDVPGQSASGSGATLYYFANGA